MASLTIRNLDDGVYERLKLEAKLNHRSVEAEARVRLGDVGKPKITAEEMIERLRAVRSAEPRMSRAEVIERLRAARIDPGPDYEGSVALIRAIRDEE